LPTSEVANISGAKVKGRGGSHFSDEGILELHDAAIRSELDRDTLLSGLDSKLVAQLRDHAARGSQMLADLHALNKIQKLTDGSIPFRSWLFAAVQLASPRTESAVFRSYLTVLEESQVESQYHARNEQ
jgi:hypothetical protein